MLDLQQGDALELLKLRADNSVDSAVLDPPAAINFMGMTWDSDKGGKRQWIAWLEQIMREVLRVIKPGGHCLVWAIPRTSHWTMNAIEDAGWEIRDVITHINGQGFPKSTDIGKQIDKLAGAKREVVDYGSSGKTRGVYNAALHPESFGGEFDITAPATLEAQQWDGWGTALKPSVEFWILARKPISERNIALNVLKWGTGGLNIDGCRIELDGEVVPINKLEEWSGFGQIERPEYETETNAKGRWPANLVLDDDPIIKAMFPETGISKGGKSGHTGAYGGGYKEEYYQNSLPGYDDKGSAARFFFQAKCSKTDREEGLENFQPYKMGMSNGAQIHGDGYDKGQDIGFNRVIERRNTHPTVKSTALMRWLCRLITPPGGTVVDPFMGSGSTGKAAILEGFSFIGFELHNEYPDLAYFDIAKARIAWAVKEYARLEKERANQPRSLFDDLEGA